MECIEIKASRGDRLANNAAHTALYAINILHRFYFCKLTVNGKRGPPCCFLYDFKCELQFSAANSLKESSIPCSSIDLINRVNE